MGREIRRVVPGWEHPRYTEQDVRHDPMLWRRVGQFMPLYDGSYEEAKREWLDALAKWESGEDPARARAAEQGIHDYWEWAGGPPKRSYYRPEWTAEQATWVQAYETVSEGTPISPAFATEDELIDWLCTHPDFWNQGPRSRETAERFVRGGWAPSAIVVNGQMHANMDALTAMGDG